MNNHFSQPRTTGATKLDTGNTLKVPQGKVNNRKTSTGSSRSTSIISPQVDPRISKYDTLIQEAERATLLFNLDMGKVELQNKQHMKDKASIALTKMAAATEGSKNSIPSEDTITLLDDTLSMAKGMTIFGKSTKTYRNARDPDNSGKFCTAPVKLDFQNKATRIKCEDILRKKCKVKCSVPYPTVIRECITSVISRVKKDFPNDFVKVTPVRGTPALKVEKISNSPEAVWQVWDKLVELPDFVLDNLDARSLPKDFKMCDIDFLTPSKLKARGGNRNSRKEFFDKEVEELTRALITDSQNDQMQE
jgi:hypothetical protein